ncbi:IDEAL domain-containing protein [Brevibacillus ruminantium]|uniref:IDEAL domain-containing protein n=1 Tax=Brevibacillus ruminantium TaxID=2950604 RepID=A0ABY4W8I7_9BACL|nr:IDEAL domain-containing protein [Brevibacillus ruminantium]USG63492.1 IDEAL domain-containing protein [Brevibacillus ruminantium]
MEWPNFYSNTYGSNNQQVSGLLSEMLIDEQVRLYRKRTLYQEIDVALAEKNKERFLELTTELREIMAYEEA